MLVARSVKWHFLLVAGLLFLTAPPLLAHLHFVSPHLSDSAKGFCGGLGIALILGSLLKARRGCC